MDLNCIILKIKYAHLYKFNIIRYCLLVYDYIVICHFFCNILTVVIDDGHYLISMS